ncbi:MAG: ABC transporter substrate-binding protein [Deltaproteobacteria bacterium]|nr:ABC transporter substrate-binding protein [Deltaproteobacteria bacterium]
MKALRGRMMSKLIMLVCLILAGMADHLGAQTRADEEARFARLRVVYPAPSPTYLACWIAREGDHFKEQGLNVELIYIPSGSLVIQAMLAGEAPIVFSGGRALVNATLGGADLVMIAGVVNVPAFYIMALPEVKTLQDLRGKKVGVTRIGSSTDFTMRLVLRKIGLQPDKDVAFVQLGDLASQAAALGTKAIAAAAFVPPFNLKAKEVGAKLLVDMAKVGAHYPHTGLVASRKYLHGSNDVVRRFLRGYAQGLRRMVADPSFAKAVLSKYTKTAEPEYLNAMHQYALDFVERVPYPTRDGIMETLRESEHPRAKNARPEDFIDDQLVRGLESEGHFGAKAKK